MKMIKLPVSGNIPTKYQDCIPVIEHLYLAAAKRDQMEQSEQVQMDRGIAQLRRSVHELVKAIDAGPTVGTNQMHSHNAVIAGILENISIEFRAVAKHHYTKTLLEGLK